MEDLKALLVERSNYKLKFRVLINLAAAATVGQGLTPGLKNETRFGKTLLEFFPISFC